MGSLISELLITQFAVHEYNMHRTFLYQLGRMILTQEITDTSYLLKMTLVDLESKEYSKGLKIEIQWQFETFGSSM